MRTNASLVSRVQYVTSKAARLLNNPTSPPNSNSCDTSGFRPTFPRLDGWMPGPVDADRELKVVKLSNAPGCWPDFPNAARKRRLENVSLVQLPRSLGITDAEIFG